MGPTRFPDQRQPAGRRAQDPAGTRRNIIEVATREFAANGLSGARVDAIAAKTAASKRMIYYYFGDKAGLYLSVIEAAYRKMRATEAALRLDELDPVAALRALVGFTFDHHAADTDFIRLVMIENIHHGDYLKRSPVIRELNVGAIAAIAKLYRRGVAAGRFRDGLTAVQIHWQISALCFFNVSNRATFGQIFRQELSAPAAQAGLRADVIDMVLRYVLAGGD